MVDRRTCIEVNPTSATHWCPSCKQTSVVRNAGGTCYRQADADEAANRAQEGFHDVFSDKLAPQYPEEVRLLAIHPHALCPYCPQSATFTQLFEWLTKNSSSSQQVTAERLLKAFTLTPKG